MTSHRNVAGELINVAQYRQLAMHGAVALLLVFGICFVGEPVAEHLLGHGPNDIFPMAVDVNLVPAPAWTRVPNTHGVVPITAHTPRTLFVLDEHGVIRWSQTYSAAVNPGVDGILSALEAMGATEAGHDGCIHKRFTPSGELT